MGTAINKHGPANRGNHSAQIPGVGPKVCGKQNCLIFLVGIFAETGLQQPSVSFCFASSFLESRSNL